MIETFSSLSKLFRYKRIHIDGTVFRLHTTLTVLLLMCFCIIVSTKQFIGEPIDCDYRDGQVKSTILNTYCYIHTTYSVKSAFAMKVGEEVPYPGIAPVKPKTTGNESDESDIAYHFYYQWIWFILFFQAVCFYVPRWVWKCWENGLMSSIVSELSMFEPSKTAIKRKLVVEFLVKTRGQHDWYVLQYFFCEVLSFVNCIGQMLLINHFLGDEFFTYGFQVISFAAMDPNVRVDPMIKVFPRMTKCHFNRFGSSGTVEKVDSLCLLPINIYNEKIFIFLWFWFYFLVLITAVVIVFRFVLIACPFIRFHICRMRFQLVYKTGNDSEKLNQVISNMKLGDWFIVHMLGQNTETVLFREILRDLVYAFQVKSEKNSQIGFESKFPEDNHLIDEKISSND